MTLVKDSKQGSCEVLPKGYTDRLTLGSPVHFVMPNGNHRPAIVTEVWAKNFGNVNLTVFHEAERDGICLQGPCVRMLAVFPDPAGEAGNTWHWAEEA